MATSLPIRLRRLFDILKEVNSPLCDIFRDGLTNEMINRQIRNLEIDFSPQMFELYEWKNGIAEKDMENKTLGELWLFSMMLLPALDFYVATYDMGKDVRWDKNLFPIFTSGGGDYLLIDCAVTSSTYGMLFFDSPSNVDFEGIITIYDSLEILIEAIIECYETGAYYYDLGKEPGLQYNDDLEQEIFIRHNLKSEYWNLFK